MTQTFTLPKRLLFSVFRYVLTINVMFLSYSLYCQNLPAGFTKVQLTTGLGKPTAMAFAPDGRIFVTLQTGAVKIIKNGTLLSKSMMQLKVDFRGEGGLIGIIFDPGFATNHYFYLYYTLPDGSRCRISRFTANGDNVVSGSEKVVLNLSPSAFTNHFGGAMHFGKDGMLYVATGDNEYPPNSSNLDNWHGKILRIRSDGSIPPGNPFTGSEVRQRIWAYGLRHPYTFDIQPGTGRIFLNDVGNKLWEEIDEATTGGKNFGWPDAEGNSTNSAYSNPYYTYPHGDGTSAGCAVTGGVFFNPATTNYPAEYIGKYFYQDYCNGWINYLDINQAPVKHTFATGVPGQALALDVGVDGNLYYIERSTGSVFKIIYTNNNNTKPTIVSQPQTQTISAGQPASFAVTATGTSPLTYQWQKNNVNIPGATSANYTIPKTTDSDKGAYRVIVSNSYGSVTSNNATLTVSSFNASPVAKIIAPTPVAMFRAGETLQFSGDGTDSEDGSLPPSAFTWEIDFHHNTHIHDSPPIAEGTKQGSFTFPVANEFSANVYYRLKLTVIDSKGLKDTTSIGIYPYTSTMSFQTTPTGLDITLDGTPTKTPTSVLGVEGIERTLGVVSPQVLNGKTYTFSKWLHGGAAIQTISTPKDNTTYTAVFTENQQHNESPVAEITTPKPSTKYRAGETLQFSGDGTDAEDGSLPATAFTWEIDFHHDSHIHNSPPITQGAKQGSFTFPVDNETSANVYYRLKLTITDSKGAKDTTSVALYPYTSSMTFDTQPQGLEITVDGTSLKTPSSMVGVQGIKRTLGVVSPQFIGGKTYKFSKWLHGGDATQTISTPKENTTYTAVFTESPQIGGISYSYYEGQWNALPNYEVITPVKSGVAANIDLSLRNRNDYFGFKFYGYITIPADGLYTFYLKSDDGSKLYLDNTLLIDNDGIHDIREKPGSKQLSRGKHPISVIYFDKLFGNVLQLSYSGPGIAKQVIPASLYSRTEDSSPISIRLEAEDALLSGPRVFTNHSGYTGSGFADFESASGDFIEWTVNENQATTYSVRIRYAASATRNLEIKVNNAVIRASQPFLSTGGWDSWRYLSFDVPLISGSNKIRITAIGTSGPNVDHLLIQNPGTTLASLPTADENLFIHPNPVNSSQMLKIYLSAAKDEHVDVMMTNSLGQKITQGNFKATSDGENSFEMPVYNIKEGAYILKIKRGTVHQSKRVLIINYK